MGMQASPMNGWNSWLPAFHFSTICSSFFYRVYKASRIFFCMLVTLDRKIGDIYYWRLLIHLECERCWVECACTLLVK